MIEYIMSIGLGAVASWLQGEKTKNLKPWMRYAISVVASICAGFLSIGVELMKSGEIDTEKILANIGLAFTASQTYYNLFFKKP